MGRKILEIKHLQAGYQTKKGRVMAVDGVNLTMEEGEFLGLAGESGCGKSTLAYAIMGLLQSNGHIFDGEIALFGQNLTALSPKEMRKVRWDKVAMVFQSAMSALNPVLRIGDQLMDGILAHRPRTSRQKAREKVVQLMEMVDLSAGRLDDYPHQLSGGMKQRVIIAMALVLEPDLVIMDEPTTALDVVVQSTIIEKINELQRELGFSVLFITHDLSLLIEISHHLMIMYGGRIMERGIAHDLYQNPLHPYTQGLMNSFPPLRGGGKEFGGIPGKPPSLMAPPPGCRFQPRCTKALPVCEEISPPIRELADQHFTACHLYNEEGGE